MIRFIVETYTSKADIYGNTYTYAIVTSTRTHASVRFQVADPSNVRMLLRSAGLTWDDFHHVEVRLVPIRRFQYQLRQCTLYEHEVTKETILGLESRTKRAEPREYEWLYRDYDVKA